jgi:YidC/Oxa1 family membrane protein insertase
VNFNQRLVLFAILTFGMIVGYEALFPPPEAPPVTEGEAAPGSTGDEAAPATTGTSASSGAEAGAGTGSAAPTPAAEPTPDQTELVKARIANDLMAYELSSARRGSIDAVEALSPQFAEAEGGLDFLDLKGESSLMLDFVADGTDFGWSRADWAQDAEASEDGKSLVLVRRTNEVEVRQHIEVGVDYQLHYAVEVRNLGSSDQSHQLSLGLRMGQDEEGNRYDIHRVMCKTSEDTEDFDNSDLEDEAEIVKGGVKWIAADSKYFAHIAVPKESFGRCEAAMPDNAEYLAVKGIMSSTTLGAGESKRYEFELYNGAKEAERLAAFDGVPNAHLEDAIDWGWFGGLSKSIGELMLRLLRFFYEMSHIWGVAIILLTVVVKMITLPLTLKQYNSMRKMRDINPEIAKIKEKYADDRVKLSQETQALFAREGVNPLAGCLPMLVQFPVWIALYAMLGTVVELYHEPFLWLPDLTKADPYYILPVLMTGMMFLQFKMQPSAADNEQAKIMQMVMPGVMGFMMVVLPSGLGVYIFANIVLSLIQSFIQLRPDKKKAEESAATT